MAISINRLFGKDLSLDKACMAPNLPYDESSQPYFGLLTREPDNAQAWYRHGQAKYAAKDYVGALSSFLTAYYFSRSDKVVLFWAGLALDKLDRYREALKCFYAAKRYVDRNVLSNNIAVCYAKLGDYRAAIKLLKRITKQRNSQSSTAFSNLGFIFLRLGQYYRAIDSFQQGLKLDPSDATLLMAMGVAYEAMHNDSMADQWYLRALELNPTLQEALKGRVRCLLGLKRASQALDYINAMLKQDQSDPEGWWLKGLCHDSLGEYRSAVSCYNHALTLRARTR